MEQNFSIGGIIFMSLSWAIISGILIFSFRKAFGKKKNKN